MTKTPPLLPAEILRRTLRTARFNGSTVLLLSGMLALVSAASQDKIGTLVGLLIAGAGAMELHGGGLLLKGDSRGVNWLAASQLYLLATVLAFAGYQLQHVNLDLFHQVWSFSSAESKQAVVDAGYSEDQFLTLMYGLLYYLLALLSIPYQGGMAIYYWRRRQAIAAALPAE